MVEGIGDGRWEMGDGRLEMGDGRLEMGDGRLEMGDGRLEMGDGRLEIIFTEKKGSKAPAHVSGKFLQARFKSSLVKTNS
jgi:hypothetical protein